jgi:hypothetical protein
MSASPPQVYSESFSESKTIALLAEREWNNCPGSECCSNYESPGEDLLILVDSTLVPAAISGAPKIGKENSVERLTFCTIFAAQIVRLTAQMLKLPAARAGSDGSFREEAS